MSSLYKGAILHITFIILLFIAINFNTNEMARTDVNEIKFKNILFLTEGK